MNANTFGGPAKGVLLALCAALLSLPMQAAHLTVQPATGDAVARSSADKKNFGDEPILELKSSTFTGVSEAYIRVDLPSTAAFCNKMVLRLFAQLQNPGSAQVVVRSITDTNWSENTLTWKWRPEHGTTLGMIQVVGVSGSWYELDVTEHVKSELALGRKSASFVLVPGEGAKAGVSIKSREADSHRPEMVLSRELFSAKVSFTPKTTPAPSGYLADHGDAYGLRSAGLKYGWNRDMRGFVRDRTDPKYKKDKHPPIKGPDRRYDFMMYMDNEKMTNKVSWEMSVPNGSYKVHVVAGDAQKFDSIYGMTMEKLVVVDGIPDSSKRWIEGTATVTVRDGKLTLENTANSSNNKLCYLELNEIEPLASK